MKDKLETMLAYRRYSQYLDSGERRDSETRRLANQIAETVNIPQTRSQLEALLRKAIENGFYLGGEDFAVNCESFYNRESVRKAKSC